MTKGKLPLRVVFCGTPDIGIPCLEFLRQHLDLELCLVITQPNRAAGRGQRESVPAIAKYSIDHKLPFIQTENINKDLVAFEKLKSCAPDLIIVFAFSHLLGKKILDLPTLGCFNIHTSILPKYRGAAPIQYALLNGDVTTGISIQKIVKKLDAGDLVQINEITIGSRDTTETLYQKLKKESVNAIKEFIGNVLNQKLIYVEQDESKATYAPTIKKEDGLINFHSYSSEEIENKLKAFTPWPGIYCFVDHRRLKLTKVKSVTDHKLEPGKILVNRSVVFIGCLGGCVQILEAQWEGKAACLIRDIINGFRGKWEITNDGK